MMKGKKTCKILKDIRREIAKANDIDLVISECTYKGDCAGTCPKCEAEVRYLEEELARRQRMGKKVAVVGLVASLMSGVTSCGTKNKFYQVVGDVPYHVEEIRGKMPAPNADDSISADSADNKVCELKQETPNTK